MNWLVGKTVALSVSTPEDMAQRGMGMEHFNDALGEITRQLLALGARLMYGGDLRAGGVTRMLFELGARYFSPSIRSVDHLPAIVDVIPYYSHAELDSDDLRSWEAELAGVGQLLFMSRGGDRAWSLRDRPENLVPEPMEEWAESLTAMRAYVTNACDARVVIGGKTSQYRGRMPGIAEEAYLSLSARKPLFAVGGFGGAAQQIARDIAAGDPMHLPDREIVPIEPNGLARAELQRLAESPHIDEIVVLVVRGLRRLFVT